MASHIKWEDLADHLKVFGNSQKVVRAGKQFEKQLTREERKAQVVAFANFPGANIFNMADNAELGRKAQQYIIMEYFYVVNKID